jgi:nucleotide-binding universal stress UspA family protein
MKTIIVATDFSSAALNAAKYAIDIAEVINADILLLNVFEILPNYNEILINTSMSNLQAISEKDMDAFRIDLLSLTQTKVNISCAVRTGVFAVEVNVICDEIMPYAIVMGCQGKTAAERIFFGAHTVTALNNLSWPLIAVPVDAAFSGIKEIGIAYDFEKEIDESLIAEIKLLAGEFRAEINIINAAKEDEFDGDFMLLSRRLEKMLSPNIVKFHFVAGENINESIIEFTENNRVDLLIVMPKHKSLWEKFIGRGHTIQMVLHSHIPVLSLVK